MKTMILSCLAQQIFFTKIFDCKKSVFQYFVFCFSEDVFFNKCFDFINCIGYNNRKLFKQAGRYIKKKMELVNENIKTTRV